jgi:hypothetical protein
MTFNSAVSSGMSATISKLFPNSPPSLLSSGGQQWLLLPKKASPPPDSIRASLEKAIEQVHATAEDKLVGSILAGPSSESDEFADVATWIPNEILAEDQFTPEKAMQALGLEGWGDQVWSHAFILDAVSFHSRSSLRSPQIHTRT